MVPPVGWRSSRRQAVSVLGEGVGEGVGEDGVGVATGVGSGLSGRAQSEQLSPSCRTIKVCPAIVSGACRPEFSDEESTETVSVWLPDPLVESR